MSVVGGSGDKVGWMSEVGGMGDGDKVGDCVGERSGFVMEGGDGIPS